MRVGPITASEPRISSPTRAGAPIRSEEHTSELQSRLHFICRLFFLNVTASTEIFSLSLHASFPICVDNPWGAGRSPPASRASLRLPAPERRSDRKSTRLNSSHGYISYAVFFF